jgi:hypothetical protein
MTYTELRLFKYRVLIIVTLLTLCSLAASCQITKVDNGFLISRDYAEFIAARFDSLETYKKYAGKLETCDSILYNAEMVISAMKVQYNMQSDMIKLKDDMIESYERGNVICNDYAKQIKKEKRLKKVWKITTYAFISVSLGALTYSIFK